MGLAEHGDEASADKLFTLPYRELRRLARRQLVHQGDVSIPATKLIREACLDIATQEGQSFPDRGRFMAYATTHHRSCSQSAGESNQVGSLNLRLWPPTLGMQSGMIKNLGGTANRLTNWLIWIDGYLRLWI